MKKSTLFLLPVTTILLLSNTCCENKSKTDIKDILPQYEITEAKDTINYVDKNGLKQGHWILYEVGPSNVNVSITHSPDSTNNTGNWESSSGRIKTEEGVYKNDKKTGYWKSFAKDGSVKDSVEFQ